MAKLKLWREIMGVAEEIYDQYYILNHPEPYDSETIVSAIKEIDELKKQFKDLVNKI